MAPKVTIIIYVIGSPSSCRYIYMHSIFYTCQLYAICYICTASDPFLPVAVNFSHGQYCRNYIERQEKVCVCKPGHATVGHCQHKGSEEVNADSSQPGDH